MSALPQDDELTSLLNDLDDISDVKTSKVSIKEQNSAPDQSEEQEPEKTEEEEEDVPEHGGDELPDPKTDIDLQGLYSNSVQELLSNYRKDRQDIDEFITYLWKKLKKPQASRVMFETLAISLRTKSEANSNLVKLLENVNKRLDKSSSVDGLDLEGLLDE